MLETELASLSLSKKAVGPGGTNGRDKVLYFVTNNPK